MWLKEDGGALLERIAKPREDVFVARGELEATLLVRECSHSQ